jgi:hypothetical protein
VQSVVPGTEGKEAPRGREGTEGKGRHRGEKGKRTNHKLTKVSIFAKLNQEIKTNMKIIKDKISIQELQKMAENMFGDLVKAVVDIEKKIIAVDAELHSDEEAYLIENGSKQNNLWGINIYPYDQGQKMIEFDSMINVRPSQGNKTRGINDSQIQKSIIEIVNNIIEK